MPTLSLRSGLLSLLVTLVFTIPACSSGGDVSVVVAPPPQPTPPTVTRVATLLIPSQLAPGQSSRASAIAYDANNNVINGLPVNWTTSNAAVATVSPSGVVNALATGLATISAIIDSQSASVLVTVAVPGPITEEGLVNTLLGQTPLKIQTALDHNRQLIQRNQRFASFIQAKITMLQQPGLADDIVRDRRSVSLMAASVDGRAIPVVAIYPEAKMRAGAQRVIEAIRIRMPILEEFMGVPYQTDRVKIWYGFAIGMDSEINLEDEDSYQARAAQFSIQPYEAGIGHELAHSMMGHEALNLFLEIYLSNMVRHQSTRLQDWSYTQGYVAGAASNKQLHAVLDIYRLIGFERMRSAYRQIRPLLPRYGSELSAEAKQAFIDAAPVSERAAVSALVEKIGI